MRVFKIKPKIQEVKTVPIKKISLGFQKSKEHFAEFLRENPTESERLFCALLDQRKIVYEFQPVICGYIPDFYFPKHKQRIIELDGKCHDKQKDYDRRRDDILRKHGYRIMRVASSRLFWDIDRLTDQVRSFLIGAKSTKRLKPKRPRKFRQRKPDEMLEQFRFVTEGL